MPHVVSLLRYCLLPYLHFHEDREGDTVAEEGSSWQCSEPQGLLVVTYVLSTKGCSIVLIDYGHLVLPSRTCYFPKFLFALEWGCPHLSSISHILVLLNALHHLLPTCVMKLWLFSAVVLFYSKYLAKMSEKWRSRKKRKGLKPDELSGLCIYIAWLIHCKNWDERRANESGVQMRFTADLTTE